MIDRDQELCSLGRLFRSDEELSSYIEWSKRVIAKPIKTKAADSPGSLSEGDREEEFIDWLEAHRVPVRMGRGAGVCASEFAARGCSMSWPL